jgi:hypothetical protein
MSIDYEKTAKESAGNWMKFDSFGWHDQPKDAEKWAIFYTHNRDSGVLEQSNADAIKKEMDKFDERTVIEQHHGHWAVGWVDGYAIKCFTNKGEVTKAFKAWCDLAAALESYPVLDEEDFSRREQEEADEVWRDCYNDRERLNYIRKNRSQFDFGSMAELMECVRGKCFRGYASELIA